MGTLTKKVVISKVEGTDLAEKLEEVLKKIGFKAKGKVFVKPNMCMLKYVPGAVTSPKVIYHLVQLFRNSAEEVIVGESDGYNYSCDLAFEKTGIKEAAEKAGGRTLNLSRDRLVQVNIEGFRVKKLFLPKTLFEVNSIVNVPVMKMHEFTTYSGAIKNLFGLIPDSKRIFLHPHINEVLFILYKLTKPITVMDSLTAMEGSGPTRGSCVQMNLILASECALALDIIATEIIGINWREISHLNYIAQKTLIDRQSIRVIGLDAKYYRKFILPTIDLPVKIQHKIYKHASLTKVVFSQPELIKVLQKVVLCYRRLRKRIFS